MWRPFLQVCSIVPLLLVHCLSPICVREMATKTVLIEFNDECYQVSFQSAADNGGPSDLHALREATAAAGIFQAEPFQIKFKIALQDWGGRLVTVLDGDSIPDKSILKASLKCVQVRYEEFRLL